MCRLCVRCTFISWRSSIYRYIASTVPHIHTQEGPKCVFIVLIHSSCAVHSDSTICEFVCDKNRPRTKCAHVQSISLGIYRSEVNDRQAVGYCQNAQCTFAAPLPYAVFDLPSMRLYLRRRRPELTLCIRRAINGQSQIRRKEKKPLTHKNRNTSNCASRSQQIKHK